MRLTARPRLMMATVVLLSGELLQGCTVRDVIGIAVSRDPRASLERAARSRALSYAHNPRGLVADLRQAREQMKALLNILRGEAGKEWGRDQVVTPGRKRYVKYTQSYRSRAVVRFDTGRIRVETVDPGEPRASLHAAIVTTLLTPSDPRAVDLYSDEPVKLTGRPYLHGLVHDHRGRVISGPKRAEAYADHLIAERMRTREIETDAGIRRVYSVELAMVSDYRHLQAQRYEPFVEHYANHYEVSESLVLAVMKTESDFNPFAVSSAPAYGLMQLVPTTGGRDAYRHAKGRDRIPSRQYLFDPERNIELGVAYLQLVRDHYLEGIRNPVSREYCTIAAYNGGIGNVFQAFSPRGSSPVSTDHALRQINTLRPPEVYHTLQTEHRHAETRRYLRKVLNARKLFSGA